MMIPLTKEACEKHSVEPLPPLGISPSPPPRLSRVLKGDREKREAEYKYRAQGICKQKNQSND